MSRRFSRFNRCFYVRGFDLRLADLADLTDVFMCVDLICVSQI